MTSLSFSMFKGSFRDKWPFVYVCVRVLMRTFEVKVCKMLVYEIHHDTDVKDSAPMQREILIKSLPLMLIIQPQLDNKRDAAPKL